MVSDPYTTITIRQSTKDRLALLKGRRSWDAFFDDVADDYLDDETRQELEKRLAEVMSGKAQTVPLDEVREEVQARRRKRRR